jgi:hypothetical protein
MGDGSGMSGKRTYKVAPMMLEPLSMQRKYMLMVLPAYTALAYVSDED